MCRVMIVHGVFNAVKVSAGRNSGDDVLSARSLMFARCRFEES